MGVGKRVGLGIGVEVGPDGMEIVGVDIVPCPPPVTIRGVGLTRTAGVGMTVGSERRMLRPLLRYRPQPTTVRTSRARVMNPHTGEKPDGEVAGLGEAGRGERSPSSSMKRRCHGTASFSRRVTREAVGRRSGSLASISAIRSSSGAGISLRRTDGRVGMLLRIALVSWSRSRPSKGRRPVTIRYSTTPRA